LCAFHEWLLEDALSQIAGEKERIRRGGRDGRKEAQLRHTEVLRLVDDNVVERFLVLALIMLGDRTEDPGFRQPRCAIWRWIFSKIGQSRSRCLLPIRLLRPSLGALAYALADVTFQASTTLAHSDNRNRCEADPVSWTPEDLC
jgi:hypothetical protein